jgi:AhpD family alkylhydroperoxidase
MKLDEKNMRLIAVGASVAANCPSCLQTNVTKARQEGIGEQEIAAAIEVGKMVRQGAASKLDRFALSMASVAQTLTVPADEDCGCNA